MIKPRTTFVLYIIVLILVYLFLPWKGIFFVFFSILFLSHLIYCSANICSQAYIKTYCKSQTTEKKITITFDDGPNHETTPEVLELLESFNVKATFFCIGNQIEKNKEILKSIDSRGHLIGNHTWSHERWFDLYPSQKMKLEIEKTNGLIFDTIGKKTKLFRPPYGVTNPSLRKAIKDFNFITIGLSIRSFDTMSNAEKTFKRIKKKLSFGDVILFHDNRDHITEILKLFLEYAHSENYKIVPLDELLNIKAYE
ncbi:MAG: polysaccharide deacetylase family protein [Marinilabiliales bacterium]|nr:MAG: polysaccharide deacetylase family protein [Marinilabiliales bacterium]